MSAATLKPRLKILHSDLVRHGRLLHFDPDGRQTSSNFTNPFVFFYRGKGGCNGLVERASGDHCRMLDALDVRYRDSAFTNHDGKFSTFAFSSPRRILTHNEVRRYAR
jgi:hypothetical protein